jgi:hypothetical protein
LDRRRGTGGQQKVTVEHVHVHGVISNNRLVSMDDGKVCFRWKDYRDEPPLRANSCEGVGGLGLSSVRSPVASSTISLPSWFGSRGRLGCLTDIRQRHAASPEGPGERRGPWDLSGEPDCSGQAWSRHVSAEPWWLTVALGVGLAGELNDCAVHEDCLPYPEVCHRRLAVQARKIFSAVQTETLPVADVGPDLFDHRIIVGSYLAALVPDTILRPILAATLLAVGARLVL